MKRYYCNGKKGYCDRGNDNNIDCKDCYFANGEGGEIVDCLDTVFEKIKDMSIDQMAKYFGEELNVCCYENKTKRCPLIGGCSSCWKSFLQE